MRDTKRKRAILAMLESHDERQFLEYGPAPYSATTIAAEIGGSTQSVARTLRGMLNEGLVFAVRDREEVWNTIARNFIPMPVTAYFSARTMHADIAAAQRWRDGAAARSDEAGQALMRAFSGQSQAPMLPLVTTKVS
ncbi:hypothetical protein QCE63_04930 [Caballeronia sp. LZ065]|uniref:hypothetical protein n=1 Tax=Caballeronia sp. LZ065 TaxID=3038571 RepID=UPI0028628A56|nr:hypothetical protein [Caballeronia sp. LZ065]MDR5778775.1 hypothetical protein [Caballeronia sp. LZ065]